MNGTAVLIIVGLIGIAVGFALGVAITSLRGPREEKRTVDTAQIEARIHVPPPKPVPPAEATPRPIAPASALPADQTTPPAQRPTISAVNVIARALQSDVRSPEPPPRSIAAQIDEILQEMLENSALASRGIRLMELPGKGMVVMVGLNQYEGVEAVPDDEIRQLIRNAVAEWERRVAE
jgi:hypothetical protein